VADEPADTNLAGAGPAHREQEGSAAQPAARHTSPPAPEDVDWEVLRAKAIEIMGKAYAPYSRFPVGVAGIVDDGRIVVGCNVENAAYGVGLCAECGLVSELHATGGGKLVAVSCVGRDGEPLMPCGRCRQLLWENGTPETLLLTPEGVLPMRDVLPQAFGPDNLSIAGPPA
jgi:cytidine deaminase